MIRQALAVGFTLDELGTDFSVSERGGVPCQAVRNLAAKKLSEIDVQLRETVALRDELREALRDWDLRLAETPLGKQAGLLKSLAARNTGKIPSKGLRAGKRNLKRKGNKHE